MAILTELFQHFSLSPPPSPVPQLHLSQPQLLADVVSPVGSMKELDCVHTRVHLKRFSLFSLAVEGDVVLLVCNGLKLGPVVISDPFLEDAVAFFVATKL